MKYLFTTFNIRKVIFTLIKIKRISIINNIGKKVKKKVKNMCAAETGIYKMPRGNISRVDTNAK